MCRLDDYDNDDFLSFSATMRKRLYSRVDDGAPHQTLLVCARFICKLEIGMTRPKRRHNGKRGHATGENSSSKTSPAPLLPSASAPSLIGLSFLLILSFVQSHTPVVISTCLVRWARVVQRWLARGTFCWIQCTIFMREHITETIARSYNFHFMLSHGGSYVFGKKIGVLNFQFLFTI